MNKDSKSIKSHYKNANEKYRLRSGMGLLEFSRMSELIKRFFPPAPAKFYEEIVFLPRILKYCFRRY